MQKYKNIIKVTALFIFIFTIVRCTPGIYKRSDMGMSFDTFTNQVSDYAVLEAGANYGIYTAGDGKQKRVLHFKDGKLVKIERVKPE